MTRLIPISCFIAFLVLTGCGSGEVPATVTGSVSYNGIPVERGTITLVPNSPGGQSQSITAEIANGKYTVQTTAGPKKVMIVGTKVLRKFKDPNDPDGPWLEQTSDYIPERFNVQTELTLDVQKGANDKNWVLEHNK